MPLVGQMDPGRTVTFYCFYSSSLLRCPGEMWLKVSSIYSSMSIPISFAFISDHLFTVSMRSVALVTSNMLFSSSRDSCGIFLSTPGPSPW